MFLAIWIKLMPSCCWMCGAETPRRACTSCAWFPPVLDARSSPRAQSSSLLVACSWFSSPRPSRTNTPAPWRKTRNRTMCWRCGWGGGVFVTCPGLHLLRSCLFSLVGVEKNSSLLEICLLFPGGSTEVGCTSFGGQVVFRLLLPGLLLGHLRRRG